MKIKKERMIKKEILIFLLVFIIVANIVYSFQTNSSNYRNFPLIISSGGEIMNSSNYKTYTATGIIAGITNSSTYKNFLGFFYGWLLADGQPCTANNQCEGSFCCSNVCRSSSCPVAPAAVGGDGGPAAGAAGGGFFVRDNETLAGLLSIRPESIKIKIILGETSEEKLTLTSAIGEPIAVFLKGENLEDYLLLSDDFIELEFGETKEIKLNFIAKKVGAFVGEIIATIRGFGISVPIILEVVSGLILFDVKLDIPNTMVEQGDELKTQITLLNVDAPKGVDVLVTYFIKDLRGNVIYEETETFVVQEHISYPKSFKINENQELGNYVVIAEVRYAASFAVSSQLFEVTQKKLFELQEILRSTTIMISLILVLVILFFLVYKFLPLKKKRK